MLSTMRRGAALLRPLPQGIPLATMLLSYLVLSAVVLAPAVFAAAPERTASAHIAAKPGKAKIHEGNIVVERKAVGKLPPPAVKLDNMLAIKDSLPPAAMPVVTLPPSAPPPAAQPKSITRGPTTVTIVKPHLSFSTQPNDIEISTARVFKEPLTPVNKPVTAGENSALAKSLLSFKDNKNPEDTSALSDFIAAYPHSRWVPSLALNLGQRRFECGYLTDALDLWKSAWEGAKDETSPDAKAVADRAIAELLLLDARLGRTDELKTYMSEINHRPLFGSNEEKVADARSGLWMMEHQPGVSFKCGPYALNTLLYLNQKSVGQNPVLKAIQSTKSGTNLAQVKNWADQVGLKYQIAKRAPGAPVIVPAVMHWKVGHFAALTAFKKGRYQVKDPTFGTTAMIWLTPQALEDQTDGYYLIPQGLLPKGWQAVKDVEARTVWGKGDSVSTDPDKPPTCDKTDPSNTCPKIKTAAPQTPMARASAFTMQATLNIFDTPLGYSPPVGPAMNFLVNYNYLEFDQPATFTFSNLGPDWSFNWLAYVELDVSQNATVFVPGGGVETYAYSLPDNVSNPYPPALTSQAMLTVTGAGTYQRLLPDGSIEVYNQPDGTGRVFMTQLIDPQGNAATIQYDANFRVTSITDTIGQATTVTYLSNTVGNVGFYKIAKITDPFGRFATFAYDASTSYLISITDVIGLVSQFVSDATSSFITALSTPYGTTSFSQYVPVGSAPPATGLRFTFPDNSSAVIENWLGETKQT
jgi:YD repeat-containing protein